MESSSTMHAYTCMYPNTNFYCTYMFYLFCSALSKEAFFSQVETIFDLINNRKSRPKNGKLLKTAPSFDETLNARLSSFHHIAQAESITEEALLSHDDHVSGSLSPPPIPPKTPITDDARQLQHKKPVPPPRRFLSRSRQVSSPGTLGAQPEIESHDLLLSRQASSPDTFGVQPEIESHDLLRSRQVSSPDTFGARPRSETPDLSEQEMVSRLARRRVSSRVNSLYSLAPPPGSPQDVPGGFVFRANIDWSLSSDSEEFDYENVIPPLNPNRRLSTDITDARKLDSPPSRFAKQNSKPTLAQSNSDYVSVSQEPLSPSKIREDDKLIKKSSPIMTKRPIWFKRDSVTSTRTTPDLKRVPKNNKLKRRSRSLDASMQRKVSCPVDHFRDQAVTLSDSEDTTGGSESYPKPFHHIRMRKRFISSRPTTSSSSLGCIDMFTTSADWHCYDDDSESEDVYYINPNEVASRFTPKQNTLDSVRMADSTYLMLSEYELDNIVRNSPQRKVNVSAHSPSPLPIPIPSSDNHISEFRDKNHLQTDSRGMSDATSESGNDDSEENENGNIYENLDNDRGSPIFDNHNHTPIAFSSKMSTDDIYAQIDEIRDSVNSIPAYLSISKPSSTENVAAVVAERQRFDTSDMAKDDGYARVGVGRNDQAPLLPPRPPNFTRLRPRNHARTVPGVSGFISVLCVCVLVVAHTVLAMVVPITPTK